MRVLVTHHSEKTAWCASKPVPKTSIIDAAKILLVLAFLSLNMSGPFHVAPDLHSKKAKYLLVGAFTWLAPGQSPDDFEEAAPPNLPEWAPEIENPDGEDPEIEDADDAWGEVRAEKKRRAQEKRLTRKERRSSVKKEKKMISRGIWKRRCRRWRLQGSACRFHPKANVNC